MNPTSHRIKKVGEFIICKESILGSGAFGSIYEGHHQSDPSRTLAVKVIELSILTQNYCSPDDKSRFKEIIQREISILKMIDHKNVVKFIDCLVTSNNVYIFLEKCNGGNLQEYLEKNPFNEKDLIKFLSQIVEGYAELINKKILHRDLKPQNILIHDGVFKISDFGLSRIVSDCSHSQMLTNKVGSPWYMAPEVCETDSYSNKCDMWSLGIITYELLYGEKPWKGVNLIDLHKNIRQLPLKFPENHKNFNKKINEIIAQMLEIDPIKRMNWDKLKSDEIFK
jgi:serine/threonine protein kinase